VHRVVLCFDVMAQQIHFCDYENSLNVAATEESEESYIAKTVSTDDSAAAYLACVFPGCYRLFLCYIDAGCFIVFSQWYCFVFLLLY